MPDSAATASAIYSGVKTMGYSMGYDSSIDHNDPASMLEAQKVTTLLTYAQEAGKATGGISSITFQIATCIIFVFTKLRTNNNNGSNTCYTRGTLCSQL